MKYVQNSLQIEELTGFRSATIMEVLAVHRQPYLELLQRIVASKAPCDVESAPTYATPSTYEDAFHVRVPCPPYIPLRTAQCSGIRAYPYYLFMVLWEAVIEQ